MQATLYFFLINFHTNIAPFLFLHWWLLLSIAQNPPRPCRWTLHHYPSTRETPLQGETARASESTEAWPKTLPSQRPEEPCCRKSQSCGPCSSQSCSWSILQGSGLQPGFHTVSGTNRLQGGRGVCWVWWSCCWNWKWIRIIIQVWFLWGRGERGQQRGGGGSRWSPAPACELADADGAAEDNQREEEAEERHRAVAARALHLPDAPRSQTPLQHCCSLSWLSWIWRVYCLFCSASLSS